MVTHKYFILIFYFSSTLANLLAQKPVSLFNLAKLRKLGGKHVETANWAGSFTERGEEACLPDSILSFDFSSGATDSLLTTKQHYTYNQIGQIIELQSYGPSLQTQQFELVFAEKRKYDAQNVQIWLQQINYYGDKKILNWEETKYFPKATSPMEFDSIIIFGYDTIAGVMNRAYRVTYDYLPIGFKKESYFDVWSGQGWSPFGKTAYLYYPNGLLSMRTSSYFNGSDWNSGFEESYHYKPNDSLEFSLNRDLKTGLPRSRTTYTYDTTQHITRSLSEWYVSDSVWTVSISELFDYDSLGRLEMNEYRFDDNILSNRRVYEYVDEISPCLTAVHDYVSFNGINYTRNNTSYYCYNCMAPAPPPPDPIELRVYPNPFGDSGFVVEVEPQSTIELYNSIGQLNERRLSLDNQSILGLTTPPSVYWLRITQPSGEVSFQKVIKQ